MHKIPHFLAAVALVGTLGLLMYVGITVVSPSAQLSPYQQYHCCLSDDKTKATCRITCNANDVSLPATTAKECTANCKPQNVRCCKNGDTLYCKSACDPWEEIAGTYDRNVCPSQCIPALTFSSSLSSSVPPAATCCKKGDVYACKKSCAYDEFNLGSYPDGTCSLRCMPPQEGLCCVKGDQYTCRTGACLPGELNQGNLGNGCYSGCRKFSPDLRCVGRTPVGTKCSAQMPCDRRDGFCDCVYPKDVKLPPFGVCQ